VFLLKNCKLNSYNFTVAHFPWRLHFFIPPGTYITAAMLFEKGTLADIVTQHHIY
jgi:hypothetical protein